MKQEDSKERFSTTIHIKLDTVLLAFIPVLFFICSILLMHDEGNSSMKDLSEENEDGWHYVRMYDAERKDEYIVITEYTGKNTDVVVIPGYIEDLPVRVLKGHIVEYGSKYSEFVIPSEVELMSGPIFSFAYIDKITFEEGSRLKKIDGDQALGMHNVEEIILPDSVEYISKGAFAYSFDLKKLHIGPNVKEIGDGAFYATKIAEIDLDEENEYFEYKDGLFIKKQEKKLLTYDHALYEKEITIPDYIREIDKETLDGSRLETINVDEDNKDYSSINGCLYSKDGRTLYKVPEGMQQEDFEFAEGVEVLEQHSMRDNVFLDKIYIPDTVKSIEMFALPDEEIYISNSLQFADLQVFHGKIFFSGTEEDWKKTYIINSMPENSVDYEVIFVED